MSAEETIRIVPLSSAHLDEVVEIEKRSFSDPWTRGMFRSEIELAAGTFARAAVLARQGERDGILVGYLFAVLVEDEVHLGNLAVDPSYRRRGAAQMLLGNLLAEARRRGSARVTLEVRESNDGARKFYARNGFLDVAIRKRYYRNPEEDAIVMLLTLSGGPGG